MGLCPIPHKKEKIKKELIRRNRIGSFYTRMTEQQNLSELHAKLKVSLSGSKCSHSFCPPRSCGGQYLNGRTAELVIADRGATPE